MKSKLIAVFLALFFGSVLTTGAGALRRELSYQPSPSLAINKYGTLSEIFDADGKSRFGKLKNNGFEVSYRSKGKTRLISAVGNKKTTGLVQGEVKTDGQVAVVTTTTSDRALEITSYFILDEEKKTLIIRRNFKNISTRPVVLRDMREYADPALITGGQPYTVRSKRRGLPTPELFNWVLRQMNAGHTKHIFDCKIGDCPEPPPPCPVYCPSPECPSCPSPYFIRPQLITKTQWLTGKVNNITLKWRDGVTLTPSSVTTTGKWQNNETSALFFIQLQDAQGPLDRRLRD